jgi:hypothetical protein
MYSDCNNESSYHWWVANLQLVGLWIANCWLRVFRGSDGAVRRAGRFYRFEIFLLLPMGSKAILVIQIASIIITILLRHTGETSLAAQVVTS